ncbi:MAG: Glyoxalase/bleomycin resistance protein/dioxygenase [Spartobacteria bacterium]|nr:Glyoxalase/bleomycin resistance protein/dioxygenase [Spartobacteria bacterium]
MTELDFTHRFIPAKADRAARTLLLLHGTGGNENDLLDLGHAIDPDAALLSPRGKVLENGVPRFFRRLAEGVFDEADVIARARELADFVDAAVAHYEIDAKKLVAVGYSNGANIASAMVLLGIAKFPEAILFRAMVPLSQTSPVDLAGARILISAGEFDPIAQPDITKALAELFREGGADVTLKFQPAGHELTPRDVALARQWLGL